VIEDAELYSRMLGNMEAFFGLDPGDAIRRPGVVGSVCPLIPHRSVFNSVVYRDAGALAAALPELARAYEEAGVIAWTVWTPEQDAEARSALEAAGHLLDATPQAMAAPLEEVDLGDGAASLDWERAGGVEEMCAVLEEAFGWERGPTEQVMTGLERVGYVYVARADGQPAACVAAFDAGGDCGIYNVGTLAAARGRGLATGLMRQALLDAHERGCDTTSLQATAMGRPVYRRLGYRDLGVIEMWERRRS
jgi:ribosomal protein S18 acetylase RimI-like enzyme